MSCCHGLVPQPANMPWQQWSTLNPAVLFNILIPLSTLHTFPHCLFIPFIIPLPY
ncbi:hypothetical protein PAXRUDRAFT_146710 [Paxillus rubicundulus Ve08.2h10]|uniref:Uncharacterized protein n=1 Tax=Paxillus rubicundulus Ve08.2h10 TaxID=930991 RepID=A0A0D0DMA8_9AGAM|nr:hypothetical protein PAXRUDRAFT_146710 [Paxillus rubicundulus Ve08.2h10]